MNSISTRGQNPGMLLNRSTHTHKHYFNDILEKCENKRAHSLITLTPTHTHTQLNTIKVRNRPDFNCRQIETRAYRKQQYNYLALLTVTNI